MAKAGRSGRPGPARAPQRGLGLATALGRLVASFAEEGPRARGLRSGLLAAAAVVLLRTAWMSDDAYITLRTIDNFVHGYGLRWNIAERVQSFTHPLWLFLITIPYAVTHEAFYTTVLLSVATSLLTIYLVLFRLGLRPGAAALAGALLLLSRAFADYSTSGLENPLTHLLLVLLVMRLRAGTPSFRDLLWLSGIAGAAALNRLDSLLLFAPALAWSLWQFRRPRGLLALAAGFAPFAAWEIFSLVYYGLLVPNTALAKLNTGIPGGDLLRQGFYYFGNSLRQDPVTLPVIVLAVVATWASWRKERGGDNLFLVLGIGLYLAYILRIGGDFMGGRFFSAPYFLSVLVLARREPAPGRRLRPLLFAAAVVLAMLAPHPSISSGRDFGLDSRDVADGHGIADERRYYFGTAGMWNGMPAGKPAPIVRYAGLVLRRSDTPFTMEMAIGVVGYFAGPNVQVMDRHALSDPLLARLPIVERDPLYDAFQQDRNGKPAAQGWRIGHFLRNVPPGYITTQLTGTNQIVDPGLAALQDRVALLTRGPLRSPARWRAIWRESLAPARGPAAAVRAAYQPTPWDEFIAARPEVGEGYFRRALDRAQDRRVSEACEDLRLATRLDPGRGAAWSLLGEMLDASGDAAHAEEAWQRGLAADPQESTTYQAYGDFLMQRGDCVRALQMYNQASALDPRKGWICEARGRCLNQLERFDEAKPALRRALLIDPASAPAMDELGLAHLGGGDRAAARRWFEKALRRKPDLASAWSHLGTLHAMAGDLGQAVPALEKAYALDPKNPEASFQLGVVLQRRGDRARALELLRVSAGLGFAPARQALARMEGG